MFNLMRQWLLIRSKGQGSSFSLRSHILDWQIRNNCFHVDNMKQLIQDIHIDGIMTFLRQI